MGGALEWAGGAGEALPGAQAKEKERDWWSELEKLEVIGPWSRTEREDGPQDSSDKSSKSGA